nr:MAG TPA: hypothetical protein [Bacteriophage sp.]
MFKNLYCWLLIVYTTDIGLLVPSVHHLPGSKTTLNV